MKNFTLISFSGFILMLLLVTADPVLACVDYHQVAPVAVAVNESQTDMELTVSNLTIFAGAPGDQCSCGLTTYNDLFDNIYYVAFVDTLTGEPIPGFDIWSNSAQASAAWESYSGSSTTWTGFISEVVSDMIPDFPVNLVIRLTIPQPPDLDGIVEVLSAANLGTDEWDPVAEDLTDSHNSISDIVIQSWIVVDDSYFESTGITEPDQGVMSVFPNPTSGIFYVESDELTQNAANLEVYNASAQRVTVISTQSGSRVAVDLSGKSPGLYFVRLSVGNELVSVSKIVVD